MGNFVEAEAMVVAVLLADNSAVAEIDLVPQQFVSFQLREMFSTALDLIADGLPADVVTVTERINQKTGRDWFSRNVDVLFNTAGTRANLKTYCELIRLAHQRNLAMTIGKTLASSDGSDEAVSDAIRSLMDLNAQDRKFEFSIKEGMKLAITDLKEAYEHKGKLRGLPTGISQLDHMLGGLYGGDFIVVGGRPAMGKTAVLLNMAAGACSYVGVVSAEQGVSQMCSRLLAAESRVSLMNMRNGHLNDDELSRIVGGGNKFNNHPGIQFFDKPAPEIGELIRVARAWKFNYDIKALYVDYLQRLKGHSQLPKHERVGEYAKALKELARELNIPVVCLAQVNRNVDSRSNSRPNMGDLKDSGEIEQEADQIILLYRDEVYNPETADKGVMEFILEKNRHGATGTVLSHWDAKYLKVSDLAPSYYQQEIA